LSIHTFHPQLLTNLDHGNGNAPRMAGELRIAIRYITVNVPGLPGKRA
jgi:hypothetical protein